MHLPFFVKKGYKKVRIAKRPVQQRIHNINYFVKYLKKKKNTRSDVFLRVYGLFDIARPHLSAWSCTPLRWI